MMIKILRIISMVYVFFGIFLFFNQKSMIYYPNNQDFNHCEVFANYEKQEFNGTRFYFLEGSQPDKIIVYYHGNAGSACDRSYTKPTLESSGSSVIFVEYAGYSNDNISPSRDLILADVRNIDQYITNQNYQKVFVYGQSIGSGAASYHASLGNVDSLILGSPFSSLNSLAQSKYPIYPISFLLREKYDNTQWLKNYHGELLILHGDQDRLIPAKFSKDLFKKLVTKNKEYILIKAKGHNDLWTSEDFQDTLLDFIRE